MMKIAPLKLCFKKNKDITVHQRNLQILMTEVYKIIKGEAPTIMKNLFIFGKTFIILEISKLQLMTTKMQ